MIRRALPRLSDVARQSAGTGTVGFDAEIFGGRPDWEKLRAIPPITLTDEERAFCPAWRKAMTFRVSR